MLRPAAILPLLCAVLGAQYGTKPKQTAQDYPVHAQAGKLAIGAEYTLHSFSAGEEMYIAKDHLVVEVGFFPEKGEGYALNLAQFSLRVNGSKKTLPALQPTLVAESLKYREQDGRGFHPMTSIGPVVLGAPAPTERFPGDPQNRPAPGAQEDGKRVDELLVQTALPEGDFRGPISGFLYFAYRGNLKHIKSLSLEITGLGSPVSISLI